MIKTKNKLLKRIGSIIVIITVLTLLVMSILTKVIYDLSFERQEIISEIPASLQQMVAAREEHRFQSGKHQLFGALYRGGQAGLIVMAPGYHSATDEYLWQIKSLLDRGWGIFIFDPTGSGRSEGESSIGFSQELLDLRAALDYIEEQGRFGYREMMLLGHSRGGYAACGILDEGYDIAAVVSISGVNSAMDAVIQPAADAIGPIAYGNYPLLWLYQVFLFGKDTAATDAAEAIAASEVPVLIVQGSADPLYPPERYSIYSHREELEGAQVSYYLCETPGQDGHTDLLFGKGGANGALMDRIHQFFALSLEEA